MYKKIPRAFQGEGRAIIRQNFNECIGTIHLAPCETKISLFHEGMKNAINSNIHLKY